MTTERDVVVQDSYELGSRGKRLDGAATIGGTGDDIKRKVVGDGLSLRSDSLGEDDTEDGDPFGRPAKIDDEEAVYLPMDAASQRLEFPTPPVNAQSRARLQGHLYPDLGVGSIAPTHRPPNANNMSNPAIQEAWAQ